MAGYAQKILIERGMTFLAKKETSPLWGVLEECVRQKLLPYVDFALAEALLRHLPHPSEKLAALLCHLSFAARNGHLCVALSGQALDPDPRQLWQTGDDETSGEVTAGHEQLLEVVNRLVLQGTKEVEGMEAIRREENLFYLQKYWMFEELFLIALRNLLETAPFPPLNFAHLSGESQRMVADGRLLAEQAKGVEAIGHQRLTLLTGGPGTGKTYTAGHMIKLVWNSLEEDAKGQFQIAIAAPTGKAAANLQASLKRSTDSIEGFPQIKAGTLHALLGVKSSKTIFDAEKKLSADLVLVDESSMIDARLMALLLSAIKPGGRLVLLGDRHQLPSVDAGGVFSDLIELFEDRQYPGLVELRLCMRAEKLELIEFATAIKSGQATEAARLLNDEHSKIVKRLFFAEKTFQTQLLEYVRPYFDIKEKSDAVSLLKVFNSFRILTPLRQGPYGVEALNAFFVKRLASSVLPIMLMQTDYRLDLYNGEAGVLVRDPTGDYALFPGRSQEEKSRRFSAVLLPKHEYAYSVSVHKSQGSEFDHVLMLVPKGSEVFGREVFYTAATRARQRLDVWGEDEVIDQTLALKSHRLSGIKQRFKSGTHFF